MATIEELMRANLFEVFNERDGHRRRAAIERIYATGVTFSDPDESVVGKHHRGQTLCILAVSP